MRRHQIYLKREDLNHTGAHQINRPEPAFEDVGFAGFDLRPQAVENVDDAQMNAADFALVVVDESDAAGSVGRLHADFFFDLATHSSGRDCPRRGPQLRDDVAADATLRLR